MVSGDGVYVPSRPSAIALPASLSALAPVRAGGKWLAGVGPSDLIDTSAYTKTYWVDAVGGSDSNTGLSWAQRVQSIWKAMSLASASGLPSRIMVDPTAPYYRQLSPCGDNSSRNSAQNILLESLGGRVITGTFDNHTWTKTTGRTYVYEVARTNASRVVCTLYRDAWGDPLEYAWAASVAACDATEGTWYTDGTTTYVHPFGDSVPTLANCKVILHGVKGFEWYGDKNLLVRGFEFLGGADGAFRCDGGSTNTIVIDDCAMRHGSQSNTFASGTSYTNTVTVLGGALFAAFDSVATDSSIDCWNVHASGGAVPTALLVRARARRAGRGGASSCNLITGHDGTTLISIGGEYQSSYGVGAAFVHAGTKAWLVGDKVGGSYSDVPRGGSGVAASFGAWDSGPTIYLDGCEDWGSEFGVWAEVSGYVYARNHRGSGQRLRVLSY